MKIPEIVTYKRITQNTDAGGFVKSIVKNGTAAAGVIGLLISRGTLLGIMAPMGLAWYASCSGMEASFVVMTACILGSIFMKMGMLKFKYIAAILLFWAFTKVVPESRKKEDDFIPMTAAGVNLAVGITAAFMSSFPIYSFMICLFESATVWGMCILFTKSKNVIERKGQVFSEDESIAIAIMTGAALAGLQGAEIFGIKLANILSMYIILFSAYKGGIAISGAVGAALGIIAGMSQGDAPALVGVYAFVGLIAGITNLFGKVGVVAAAIVSNAVFAAYYNSSIIVLINVVEILIAGTAFLFTPDKVLKFIEKFSIKSETYNPAKGYMLRVKSQTLLCMKSIRNILEGMTSAFEPEAYPPAEDKAMVLCDRLMYKVCDKCSLNKYCWSKNFKGTSKLFAAIIQALYDGDEKRLHEIVSRKCVKGDLLISTAVTLHDIYRREDILAKRTKDSISCVTTQWNKISDLASLCEQRIENIGIGYETVSSDIGRSLADKGIKNAEISTVKNELGIMEVVIKTDKEIMFDVTELVGDITERKMKITAEIAEKDGFTIYLYESEKFDYENAVATMDKPGEASSGDSAYSFTSGGILYLVICDGMGSGEEASNESMKTVRTFEKLVRGGFEMKSAVEIINAGLISKGGREYCISLDCCSVNLFTGSVEMIKAGAAATVIKNGDNTEIVRYNSMPLGILDIENINTYHTTIETGGFIVMMTDGVPDNRGDRKLGEDFVKKIIEMNANGQSEEIANSVLMSTVTGGKPKDDMLVMCTKICTPIQ